MVSSMMIPVGRPAPECHEGPGGREAHITGRTVYRRRTLLWRPVRIGSAVIAALAFLGAAQASGTAHARDAGQVGAKVVSDARVGASAEGRGETAPTRIPAGDEIVTGTGDTNGYHLYAASSGSKWSWLPLATLQPGGSADERWIGRQCLTGDGRYVVAVVAPWHASNNAVGMDEGGYAYAIDAHTGAVRPLAAGVSLAYFDPGCGTDGHATLTRYLGRDEGATQILTVDTATGKIAASARNSGELTSAVPVKGAADAVRGDTLVRLTGTVVRDLAVLPGQPFDLRPNADGGVDFLTRESPGTAGLWRLRAAGLPVRLGSGPLVHAAVFSGRAGHTFSAGITLGTDGGRGVAGLARLGATAAVDGPGGIADAVSLDGTVALRGAARPGRALVSQGQSAGDTELRVTATGRVLTTAVPHPGTAVTRSVPRYAGIPAPAAAHRRAVAGPGAAAATATSQTPRCVVPRLDATLQVPQPGVAQIDWAAQQAARGLLTSERPDRDWSLPSSAPSSDFPLPALSGEANQVPREVVEAIMAQESNWAQASWHAPRGITGDPLVADYYGYNSAGTINYAQADCGYGLGQITSIMTQGATDPWTGAAVPQALQDKVAVDYVENAAATAYYLAHIWNDVTNAGIIANDGDPSKLENWYFAIWAYNSGLHPGPNSPWGLGWLNNPINPIYPPGRAPFLQTSYADASHPADWPYQERVFGWMGVPLGGGQPDYQPAAQYPLLPASSAFCSLSVNDCDPSDTANGFCQRSDSECWWHASATWVSACASACTPPQSTVAPDAAEPPPPANPHPSVCDTSGLPVGLGSPPLIVDDNVDEANFAGCVMPVANAAMSWTPETDLSGQPVGNIDLHQIGTGYGGRALFTHLEDPGTSALGGTMTWTPTGLSTAYNYAIEVFVPSAGAAGTLTYNVFSADHVIASVPVNQGNYSNQWVDIGTYQLYPGASVAATNFANGGDGVTDVAFDAIAFVPVSTSTWTEDAARNDLMNHIDSTPTTLEYGLADNFGQGMDTAKVLQVGPGRYIAAYSHNNEIMLGDSTDLAHWTFDIVLDTSATQPYIAEAANGSFVLADEKFDTAGATGGDSHLYFLHYANLTALEATAPDHQFTPPGPRLISNCLGSGHGNEGTPDVFNLSPDGLTMTVGFHWIDCVNGLDQEAFGTLTGFSSMTASQDTIRDNAVNAILYDGKHGGRDDIVWHGFRFSIQEAQCNDSYTPAPGECLGGNFNTNISDFSNWRYILYDYANQTAYPLPVSAALGTVAAIGPASYCHGNPKISQVNDPSGNPALVVTGFMFSPPCARAAGIAGGPFLYWVPGS
jgi:hypothetical protein